MIGNWWNIKINRFTDKKAVSIMILSFECVKVPMPAHEVLPLMGYIFEASYSTSAMQANKI